MAGLARVGAWTVNLVVVLLAVACFSGDPSTGPRDEGVVADTGGDRGRDEPGPSDIRDVAVDAAAEPGSELPGSDVGVDPGAGDAAPADPGGADLPADLSADLPADLSVDLPADLPRDLPVDLPPDAGPPGVHCLPGDVVFPDFDRACGPDSDCGLAFHQADCCGSIAVLGIRTDRLSDFQVAEDACRAQWPGCGCAARIPTADDGSTSGDLGDFEVRCESGQCLSRALPGCGDLERRVDTALAAVDTCGAATPCVLREIGPICGSFSCRQVAVAADASTEGMAVLEALGSEGLSKKCPDFHCGCDYLGVPACVEGHCRLLSPGENCQAVQDRFDAVLADPATLACGTDADCAGTTVTFAPFCTAECACAVVTNQSAVPWLRILTDHWQNLGCPIESCACTKCASVTRCVEGRCKGQL